MSKKRVDLTRVELDKALYEFHMETLAKYDKGRAEHDYAPIKDIDFEGEIMDEIKDLVVYSLLKKIVR